MPIVHNLRDCLLLLQQKGPSLHFVYRLTYRGFEPLYEIKERTINGRG